MNEDDPILNCALELCCEGEGACLSLSKIIKRRFPHLNKEFCYEMASWFLSEFDLAERGTLTPLKQSWKRLLKANGPS